MRAIEVTEPGGPEALTLTERPTPTPGPDEVLVRVHTAGVNRADVMQRKGFYPPPDGVTDIPGLEVSGTIEDVGDDVSEWSPGQEVCALLAGGGYAEYALVPVGQLLPVPLGVSLADAAALPEVASTVWSNLVMEAGLGSGDVVLLHGGSSGIGTMAIQVASALGARVAVTASSQAKLDACRALGADILIDYSTEDFVERVKDATDGHGADVVLDVVGAAYLSRNLDVLAPDGRLVVIGLQKGRTAELDLGALLAKRASVHATSLRSRPREHKARVVAQVREHLWPHLDAGRIRPVIQSRHPLADAAAAHEEMEASAHIGKILLDVQE